MTELVNVGGWLEQAPAGRTALVFEDGRSWTYGELDHWAGSISALLRDKHDVTKGDRVAFLGLNDPAMIALLFACARLGAILVPLNWRLAAAEIAFIVDDCAPNVLFYADEFAEAARACVCSSARSSALEVAALEERPDRGEGRLDDPLLIVYTSGTTGRPKGAVLSQRALVSNAAGSIDMHALS
ncbi:MAG: AMP-binding protein, partial [Pseudomonadota bacterium]